MTLLPICRAGIATAHCVTIVANRSSMANVDGQTLDSSVIFTYLMMEQALLSVPKAEDFYMVVEVCTSTLHHAAHTSSSPSQYLLRCGLARSSDISIQCCMAFV